MQLIFTQDSLSSFGLFFIELYKNNFYTQQMGSSQSSRKQQESRAKEDPSKVGGIVQEGHQVESMAKLQPCVEQSDYLNLSLKQFTLLDLDELIKKNLGNIRVLNISYNRIKQLPATIKQIQHLDKLFAYKTHLQSLPPELGYLLSLTQINLEQNFLKSLPLELGNLKKLKILSISKNKIVELPSQIVNLSSLQVLKVYSNRLTCLPQSIGNLKELQKLWIHKNNIQKLPKSIGQLSSLKQFIASHNKIKELPNQMGNIKGLEKIWLHKNQLVRIGPDLIKLEKDVQLDFRNNYLSSESIQVIVEMESRDFHRIYF